MFLLTLTIQKYELQKVIQYKFMIAVKQHEHKVFKQYQRVFKIVIINQM